MTDFIIGAIYKDRDGDEWLVSRDHTGRCEALDITKDMDRVERSYGPLTLVNASPTNYVTGQVYLDRDGDEWTVTSPRRLRNRMIGLASTEEVESKWGPLVRVEVEHQVVPDGVPPASPSRPIGLSRDLLDKVTESHGGKYTQDVVRVYTDALNVLLTKSLDYGPKNIAQSPGGALNGIRVRMWDKVARLNNLLDTNREPENESLRDTFVDLLNYSAIALMVIDKNWPGTE
jgi:hypothetical protein